LINFDLNRIRCSN